MFKKWFELDRFSEEDLRELCLNVACSTAEKVETLIKFIKDNDSTMVARKTLGSEIRNKVREECPIKPGCAIDHVTLEGRYVSIVMACRKSSRAVRSFNYTVCNDGVIEIRGPVEHLHQPTLDWLRANY